MAAAADPSNQPVPQEVDVQPCALQLSQRVAHLEADLALFARRKAELERENEALAAAAARHKDLDVRVEAAEARHKDTEARFEAAEAMHREAEARFEAQLSEVRSSRDSLEAQLTEASGARGQLEAECEALRAKLAQKEGLERQQAAITSSFAELQGIVAQLVGRLAEFDAQRSRLAEEKGAAEAVVRTLRAELQKIQGASAPDRSRGATRSATGRSSVPRPADPYRVVSLQRRSCRGSSCRTRCRAPADSQRAWATQTPPQRGSCVTAGNLGAPGARAEPQVAAPKPAGLETPTMADLRLSESQMECTLLRQRLLSEEHACAEATRHSESTAEAKTAEVQSELREMLATWSGEEASIASDTEATPP